MKNCLKLSGIIAFLLLSTLSEASQNIISSVIISNAKDKNAYELNIDSSSISKYKTHIDKTGNVYFDIKNASLEKNTGTIYTDVTDIDNVTVKQINKNKVRIYVEGKNAKNTQIVFLNSGNKNKIMPEESFIQNIKEIPSGMFLILLIALCFFKITLNLFNRKKLTAKSDDKILSHIAHIELSKAHEQYKENLKNRYNTTLKPNFNPYNTDAIKNSVSKKQRTIQNSYIDKNISKNEYSNSNVLTLDNFNKKTFKNEKSERFLNPYIQRPDNSLSQTTKRVNAKIVNSSVKTFENKAV